jgi:hypothetical protein
MMTNTGMGYLPATAQKNSLATEPGSPRRNTDGGEKLAHHTDAGFKSQAWSTSLDDYDPSIPQQWRRIDDHPTVEKNSTRTRSAHLRLPSSLCKRQLPEISVAVSSWHG